MFLTKIKVLECNILSQVGLMIKWYQKTIKIVQAKEYEDLSHGVGSENGKDGNFKETC